MPEDQPSTPVFSFSVISKSSNIVSDPVVTISSTTHSQFLTVTPFPTGKIKYYNDCASFTEVFFVSQFQSLYNQILLMENWMFY